MLAAPVRLLLCLAVAVVRVSAHFAITSPAPRSGSSDLTELTAPCGGLPITTRTLFPITGGSITGALYHPTAVANFSLVVTNTDPPESDFAKTWFGPGEEAAFTEGSFTVSADLSDVAGCVVGANVTFQVVMHTVDGILYECMDV
ncbi:hypothetical protein HDU83_000583, partial [Entophlyctis luteolus]